MIATGGNQYATITFTFWLIAASKMPL